MKNLSVKKRLFEADALRARVVALAGDMAAQYAGREVILIGVLRGSFVFLADLVRELYHHGVAVQIDFMTLESYGSNTVSKGVVHSAKPFSIEVSGREVVLVDDILDTGRTLEFARRQILESGAVHCRTCVLLDKPSRRVVPMEADFVGFLVPDIFVVGYGLDFNGRCREWPFLAELNLEACHGG